MLHVDCQNWMTPRPLSHLSQNYYTRLTTVFAVHFIFIFIHHNHNRFTALFPGPPGWAGARRKLLLDFMVLGRQEADTPTIQVGATPSGPISNPPPSISPFYPGCPSCRNPPNISWLGANTGIFWIAYPRGLVSLFTTKVDNETNKQAKKEKKLNLMVPTQ